MTGGVVQYFSYGIVLPNTDACKEKSILVPTFGMTQITVGYLPMVFRFTISALNPKNRLD